MANIGRAFNKSKFLPFPINIMAVIGSPSKISHQISNWSIISNWKVPQSPNSKVRKFNFIVPIQHRPEIEIIIYVKGPMCKQKPQTKINKLSKYGKNIKIGFIGWPEKVERIFQFSNFHNIYLCVSVRFRSTSLV